MALGGKVGRAENVPAGTHLQFCTSDSVAGIEPWLGTNVVSRIDVVAFGAPSKAGMCSCRNLLEMPGSHMFLVLQKCSCRNAVENFVVGNRRAGILTLAVPLFGRIV